MTETETKKDSLTFQVLYFLFFGGVILLTIQLALEELRLGARLAREGVQTTAIIQDCKNSGKVGYVIYAFEVPQPDGTSRTQRIEEMGTKGCGRGESVSIHYLPQNPSIAQRDNYSNVPLYMFAVLIGLILMAKEVWRSLAPWLRETRARVDARDD